MDSNSFLLSHTYCPYSHFLVLSKCLFQLSLFKSGSNKGPLTVFDYIFEGPFSFSSGPQPASANDNVSPYGFLLITSLWSHLTCCSVFFIFCKIEASWSLSNEILPLKLLLCGLLGLWVTPLKLTEGPIFSLKVLPFARSWFLRARICIYLDWQVLVQFVQASWDGDSPNPSVPWCLALVGRPPSPVESERKSLPPGRLQDRSWFQGVG